MRPPHGRGRIEMKNVFFVLSMVVIAGCTYSPVVQQMEKTPSVQRAAAVINQVADPSLMSQTYRDCRLGDAFVKTEVVNNDTTVVARASNECAGVNYRKEGVTRPYGLAGANSQ